MAISGQRREYYNQYKECLKEGAEYKKASKTYQNFVKRLTLAKDKLEAITTYRGSMKIAADVCDNLIVAGERIDKGKIETFLNGPDEDVKSLETIKEEINAIINEVNRKIKENDLAAQAKISDAQHYYNLYRDSN